MRNRATLILTTVKKALLATGIVKIGAYHAYYTVVSGDSQWVICAKQWPDNVRTSFLKLQIQQFNN
ncbi:hypothetical protein DA799_11945 [Lactiplantibacillus plantarum]|nr:hypothetical protein DA799_11945 [Lactiplantibacillus plantarum]